MEGELLSQELKRITRTARDALRAVRDLEEELDGDVHGQFIIQSDEAENEYQHELLQYVALAQSNYPGRDLTVLVIAHFD